MKQNYKENEHTKQADMMYSIGDEIVHAHYGVGEVVDIEDKELGGKTTTYYVVETSDSTYWMPVDKADNDRIRPIANSKTIEDNVIEALEADPQEMASHYKNRRKRIKEVVVSGEIVAVAELVRDLTYRQYKKGSLTTIESRNLDRLRTRLVNEWSRSLGVTKRKVNDKLRKILQGHQEEKV